MARLLPDGLTFGEHQELVNSGPKYDAGKEHPRADQGQV